jgi:hypothetical protein
MDIALAKQFAAMVETKGQLNRQVTLLNQMIAIHAQKLYDEFLDSGLKNIRVEGIVAGKKIFLDGKDRLISPDVITRPNVVAQNSEDFLNWMDKNGFGSLIKRTIAPATLKKWVNERMEANADLPPQSLMTVFTEETAKVTRAPSRKNPLQEV